MVFSSSIEGVELGLWFAAFEGLVESEGSVVGILEFVAMLEAIDELWKLWYHVKLRAFLNRTERFYWFEKNFGKA